MSFNNCKTNKFPCGVCEKNATSGAILCNGPCKKWNHFKCINMTYNGVKNMSLAERKSWQCPNCIQSTESERVLPQFFCNDATVEDNNVFEDSLTLATEIGSAILRENEQLKQALHETKKAKSSYELELEDKIIEKEEDIRNLIKAHKQQEIEMNLIIKSFENKLNMEKKFNSDLTLQATNDKECLHSNVNQMICNKCEIYKQETKNMIDSIRSLETVIDVLQIENADLKKELQMKKANEYDLKCLNCFPNMTQTKHSTERTNVWQKPKDYVKVNKENQFPLIDCRNRFMVLSEDESELDDEHALDATSLCVKTPNTKRKIVANVIKTKKNTETTDYHSSQKSQSRLLILADSHGHSLSHIVQQKTHLNVTAVVRPGAKLSGVTKDLKELSRGYDKNDFMLVIGGTNNVESCGIKEVLGDFDTLLESSTHTNLIIASLPMRHDKPNLDGKISIINDGLIEKMHAKNTDSRFLELHLLPRDLYTNHGMHFNKKGKRKIAEEILKLLRNCCLNQTAPEKQKINQTLPCEPVTIIEADMNTVISTMKGQENIAFAHCISADFDEDRHMSAGVATSFKKHFGKPQFSDFVNERLTLQRVNGTFVYGLVTKPKFNAKPDIEDYNMAFENLTQDLERRSVELLLCSPMGCVRDNIPIEHFASKLCQLHQRTGAKVQVIVTDECSTRVLRRGFSFHAFVENLRLHITNLLKEVHTMELCTPIQVSTQISPTERELSSVALCPSRLTSPVVVAASPTLQPNYQSSSHGTSTDDPTCDEYCSPKPCHVNYITEVPKVHQKNCPVKKNLSIT